MSSGGSSRVSIPSSLKKTIQDIKEIAGNHSDEEVLAMLEECAMDPNEAAQKLLHQDTFHEVKRKRDRRKENVNNREPTDSRWKQGMQGRGIRGGRGSYYSRYQAYDAGGVGGGKEDRVIQPTEKATTSPSSNIMHEADNKSGAFTAGSVPGIVDHSMRVEHSSSSQGSGTQMPGGGNLSSKEESLSASNTNSGCQPPPPVEVISPANTIGIVRKLHTPKSDQLPSIVETPDSGVCVDSDALLVSSIDTQALGVSCTTKYETEGQLTAAETVSSKGASHGIPNSEVSSQRTSQEMVSTVKQGLIATKSQILEMGHQFDTSQSLSSTFQSGTQGTKPSSNFSSRAQGLPKVGLSKEWKPKSLNSMAMQTSITVGTSDAAHAEVESDVQSRPVTSGEDTINLCKKLEELRFSDSKHVIIPDHLQVPEAERCGLSFGSFDASFGIGKRTAFLNDPDGEKLSTPPTEFQEPGDNDGESILSTQVSSSATQEEQFPEHHPETSSQMPESPSSNEADTSLTSSMVPEFDQAKEASGIAAGGPQFSVVHTAPAYSAFGLVPPMLGSQLAPFESSESQSREAPRVASFIVQPPFDPSTGYYTQIYRPGVDSDGRYSPLLAHGGTAKYGSNTAVLSSTTGQSTQETVNSLVLPNTGVTTQATGVMQTSVPVTQQPIPVFRQPASVHISPYPPNYVPYGHYISPFYVPTPTIHHFFGNTGLPQQPLPGGIYPPPAAAAAAAAATTAPVKYSPPLYKGGNNSGNSNHGVLPTGHGPYSSSPSGYGPNPSASSGHSTINEDHTVSQYKESNVYITGQQSEGSAAVWLPASGREIPSVQAGSFFNLPHGQQMTFTPQAGNGAFAGIYHPSQAVGAAAVHPMLQPSQTIAGTAASVYQQPQRAQINWPNNY